MFNNPSSKKINKNMPLIQLVKTIINICTERQSKG